MRDQPTSNREAELTAIPRIGSGDWLGHGYKTMKKDIPIKLAMWAWNPKQHGGDGRIIVIKHPDRDGECDRLNLSDTWGACCADWGTSPKRTLQLQLLIEGWHIALRDGLNLKDVHDAFMVIPEYRELLADDAVWPPVA